MATAKPKAPSLIKLWAKTSPLPEKMAAKFKTLVMTDTLNTELQAAYTYVSTLGTMEPAGITVAARDYKEVKRLMHTEQGGIMHDRLRQARLHPREC